MNMNSLSGVDPATLAALLEKMREFPSGADKVQQMLHELRVHQVELEQQNRELQLTQQELEVSRNRYAELFDFAPVAYLSLDEAGTIREINLTGAALLGRERIVLIGSRFAFNLDPVHVRRFHPFLRLLAKDGGTKRQEFNLVTAKGETFIVEATGYADRRAGLYRLALINVTEARLARESLKRSEAAYRLLADNSTDIISEHDNAGTYLYVSPSSATVLGFATKELLGENILEFCHPDDAERVSQEFFAAVSNNPGQQSVYRGRKKDGEYLWLETNWKRVESFGNGSEEVIVAQSRDITQRLRLERELAQTRKTETLGQFAGGIAHDFNNLLATMLGFTELALKQGAKVPWEEQRAYLDEVLTAGRRGAALVSQLQRYSSESPIVHAEAIEVGPVIQEVVDLLKPLLPSSVELAVDLSADGSVARIDPVQLEQILMNLCLNGRDAMLGGKGRLTMRLDDVTVDSGLCVVCGSEVSGDWLRVSVADSGEGMDESTIARIFEPFFTTKSPGKGTGMGLTVVGNIVKSLGGHILIESKPGHGTEIQVLFPRSGAVAASASIEETQDVAVTEGNGQRIVVVDDEHSLAEFLSEFLELSGYRVTTFSDSQQAREYLSDMANEVDLLITDQTMPGITGVELLQSSKKCRPNLRVILCTGHSGVVSEESAGDLQIDGYIPKPIDTKRLLEKMADLLN